MLKYLGIDIGGTHIKGGICGADGTVFASGSIDTQGDRGPQAIVDNIAALSNKLFAEANLAANDIAGIGMGIPGMIDGCAGVVTFSGNLRLEKMPIVAMLKKYFDLPVYITNDANAAALGEYAFGAGKRYNSLIFVTLGTGVGGGIVIDGKLFEGNGGAGAEIGHMVIRADGEACTCGRRGCFEVYASATALKRETLRAIKADPATKMREKVKCDDCVSGKLSFDYAAVDKAAAGVAARYIKDLAEGLVNLANIFRPDAILLGGGVSAQGETLLKPLTEEFDKIIFGGMEGPKVKVERATLGNDAGFLGAVALCIDRLKG